MSFQDEKRTELCSLKKNNRGDYLVVAKIENEKTNTVSADIRMYYTNDDDELCPTKKGCRFNAEMGLDVLTALLGILEYDELETLRDTINERLGEDDDEPESTEDEEDDTEETEDDLEEDTKDEHSEQALDGVEALGEESGGFME